MSSPQEHEAALFAVAVKKPASQRAAFLDAVCGDDRPLRARLEALLAAHEQPETMLAAQDAAARPTLKIEFAGEPADEAVGQMLGRYKLLERVGEGGCGVVYVAEQTEPVRRRVALKVIELGMDTRLRAVELRRSTLGDDHPLTLSAVCLLATTYVTQQHFDQASPLTEQVLNLSRRLPLEKSVFSAGNLRFLGWVYLKQSDVARAEVNKLAKLQHDPTP